MRSLRIPLVAAVVLFPVLPAAHVPASSQSRNPPQNATRNPLAACVPPSSTAVGDRFPRRTVAVPRL